VAAGVSPSALRLDGDVRLNPRDLGRLGDPKTRLQERVRIIAAISGASLSLSLTVEERLAVELAVGRRPRDSPGRP
jgi:hypothetical protein